MEQQQRDEDNNREYRETGRKDSVMATPGIETISLHTQQISDLGNEYNLLEEALHNL